MKEFTRKIIKFSLILFVFCAIASGILSWVNSITSKQIQANRLAEANRKRQKVLPDAVQDKFQEKEINGRKFYLGYNQSDEYVGAVFEVTGRGFGGPINITIGVNPEGKLAGIAISKLDQSETPGLGIKITGEKFQKQFVDKGEKEIKLKRDGGQIDAITAATISSNAVVKAVKEGLALYKKYSIDFLL